MSTAPIFYIGFALFILGAGLCIAAIAIDQNRLAERRAIVGKAEHEFSRLLYKYSDVLIEGPKDRPYDEWHRELDKLKLQRDIAKQRYDSIKAANQLL